MPAETFLFSMSSESLRSGEYFPLRYGGSSSVVLFLPYLLPFVVGKKEAMMCDNDERDRARYRTEPNTQPSSRLTEK